MPTIQFSNGHTIQVDSMPTTDQINNFAKQQGWVQDTPKSQSPFSPSAPNSQFVDPNKPQPGTTTGSQFLGSLGQGVSQTAQNLVNPIIGGAKEVANDTSQAFQGGINQVKQGASQFGKGGDFIGPSLNIGAGVVNSAMSPLAAPFKPVSNAVNFAADKASNIPAVQDFANSKAGQATAAGLEPLANAGTIAQGALAFAGAPEAKTQAEAGINAVGDAAKPGMKAVGQDIATGASKVTDLPGAIKEGVQSGLEKKYVKQAQTQWEKPATLPKGFNKASEIFDKASSQGHNIADTLVKNKLNPSDHIQNGLYATADTAEKLRQDAIKTSNEMLRPSLEKADLSNPKTPVNEVVKSALDNIKNNKSLTQETKDILTKKINQTTSSLQKQYPDGMSLTNLHDEKIVRDLNSKYSPVGDIATNTEAIKNKAVADAARKTLENKAPKEVPVKQFNAELSKQHQAANYLDALNGKKAPVSALQKIANTTAKVTGAAVGNGLGGGILGGVGGYHIGGMVENMFANMSNPIKNSFLRNLETTNPEAFAKVQEYLNSPTPEATPPSITTKSVAKAADLGQQKMPSTIKVNDYRSNFPKYFTEDQVSSATKMLKAKEQAGHTIDMKQINSVVKQVKQMSDIKLSSDTKNGAFQRGVITENPKQIRVKVKGGNSNGKVTQIFGEPK